MTSVKRCALMAGIALSPLSALSSHSVLAAEDLVTSLKNGDVSLNFRLRGEQVDQDGLDDTSAVTLRSRLSYESEAYQGFGVLLEMDNVTDLGSADYRTAANDPSPANKAIISDPDGTEVNQAYLSYAFRKTIMKYGRQRILLDNQRFVGGVGFRQNEQTYDGFSVANSGLANTKLFFAYVYNVNRIFGEDNPTGDQHQDTYLLNAQFSGWKAGALSGYAYLIDNDDAPNFSTDTYGVRFAGASGVFTYALEYARQADAANNPASYDADYVLAEGGLKLAGVTFTAGYELLGADGRDGQFITPLATLHKFQGWTDTFLGGGSGNIPGGIEDLYLAAATDWMGINLAVNYHHYEPDDSRVAGMDKLGREFGFLVGKKFGPVGLSLKYSDYSADDFSVDTDKVWLTAEAEF